MNTRLLAILLVGVAIFGGCETRWESAFRSTGAAMRPLEKGALVTLREAPWDRLQATLAELQGERSASDIHPDEWPAERHAEAKARLLRGLQVSADPASVEVLGRSEFRTTHATRPDDGELEAFGQKIGATMVVWSSTYLGRVSTTQQEPVTEYSTATRHYRDRKGKWRSETYTDHSTIWVPVTVEADEHAWMAYFLRDLSGRGEW